MNRFVLTDRHYRMMGRSTTLLLRFLLHGFVREEQEGGALRLPWAHPPLRQALDWRKQCRK